LIAVFACGVVLLTYGGIARRYGWSVGSWLLGPRPAIAVVALLTMLASLGLSVWVGPWWRILVTVAFGMTAASMFIPLLRGLIQPIAILGLPISWLVVLATFSVARNKPTARAVGHWPHEEKTAYVDRCVLEMAPQLPSPRNPRQVCNCLADSLEAEFGMSDTAAMMAAQPDPRGTKADRRLYRVVTSCVR